MLYVITSSIDFYKKNEMWIDTEIVDDKLHNLSLKQQNIIISEIK